MLEQATLLTTNYLKTSLARCVYDSYYADGGWWLPPDPSPDSARIALRLFPKLAAPNPELVARARLSVIDHKPIDYALPAWRALTDAERADHKLHCCAVDHQAGIRGIEPHEFQWADSYAAVRNLERGRGYYFGWEMGLGKTLGACMVMDAWDCNFVFIACPNSAKRDPWLEHLEAFTPWLHPVIMGNTPKQRFLAYAECYQRMEAGEPTALICHYDAIKLIEAERANKRGWARLGQWDLKVGDEAHIHKKTATARTAAFRRIKAAGTLLLSGSVMSGRAEQLFVPWQIMRPRVYRSQWRDWNDRFLEVADTDYGKEIIGPAQHRLNSFRAELGESLTVRPARDFLSVPEARLIDRTDLVMHPAQTKVYHALADELLAELPDGDIILTQDGAPLRTALRRVTAGIPDGQGMGLLSAKHDAVMEDILSAGDSQVLTFAWYRVTAAEVQRRCLAANIPCGLVNGDVSGPAREREIELFKAGGYRVLVATIATLSTAANLQNASIVQMVELSDDPVDNEQAVGRAVRQGQPTHVRVITYGIRDSVDDIDVASNAMSKAELRAQVLGT